MNYDVIGDIHGHADKLEALLHLMGYRHGAGAWSKSGHQAIFVGDFVDRGPRQVETVRIVRAMVEAGNARALMGNHEFNAIAWHTPDPRRPGDTLRTRHGKTGEKNRHQHERFLVEVEGKPEHAEIIGWFMTLPLWLELPGLRVVHACWHEGEMAVLAPRLDAERRLDAALVALASERGTAEYRALECVVKGLEVALPAGHAFKDKDGHERHNVRLRWWDPAADTFRKAAILGDPAKEALLPDVPLPDHARVGYAGDKPVFFGHYWMRAPARLQSQHAACVDYSAGKGGPLVAYRWQGEQVLQEAHFAAAG